MLWPNTPYSFYFLTETKVDHHWTSNGNLTVSGVRARVLKGRLPMYELTFNSYITIERTLGPHPVRIEREQQGGIIDPLCGVYYYYYSLPQVFDLVSSLVLLNLIWYVTGNSSSRASHTGFYPAWKGLVSQWCLYLHLYGHAGRGRGLEELYLINLSTIEIAILVIIFM